MHLVPTAVPVQRWAASAAPKRPDSPPDQRSAPQRPDAPPDRRSAPRRRLSPALGRSRPAARTFRRKRTMWRRRATDSVPTSQANTFRRKRTVWRRRATCSGPTFNQRPAASRWRRSGRRLSSVPWSSGRNVGRQLSRSHRALRPPGGGDQASHRSEHAPGPLSGEARCGEAGLVQSRMLHRQQPMR